MQQFKWPEIKSTLFLRLYGFLKIPLVAFVSPEVIEATPERTILKISLGYRTKNHLNAMYFGALNIGAELCVALIAVEKIKESGQKIDFLFKNYSANFIRRAEGDVHFICDEVPVVVDQIEIASKSMERINRTIKAYAVVPSSKNPSEKVAEFELTLSVRRRTP